MPFATKTENQIDGETTIHQISERKVDQLLLVEEGTVIHVFSEERLSPEGTPFKVALFEDKNHQKSTFLACSDVWDLELIKHLQGQLVRFDIEENGLKLKKLNLQPFATQEHLMNCSKKSNSISKKPNSQTKKATGEKSGITSSIEMIEQIASSLMQKAAEKGWPMCFGVLIPPQSLSEDEKS